MTIVSSIAMIATVFSFVSSISNNRLIKRLEERDDFIESLTQSDTSKTQTILTRDHIFKAGEKEMNSEEFVAYVNALLRETNEMLDSLSYYRSYYQMTKIYFGAELVQDPRDSTGSRYIYTFEHYKKLTNDQLKVIASESGKYRAIMKKYQISVEEHEGYYVVTSPQIDSALALLPFFRKNIIDASGGKYVITHY
ncbi:MAG: hypothetical protein J6Y32_08345 [Bacteroidales bacterium]|nr:hypothetical protein [Bacteroidales bacterium]